MGSQMNSKRDTRFLLDTLLEKGKTSSSEGKDFRKEE
jgi:hypothetical protein